VHRVFGGKVILYLGWEKQECGLESIHYWGCGRKQPRWKVLVFIPLSVFFLIIIYLIWERNRVGNIKRSNVGLTFDRKEVLFSEVVGKLAAEVCSRVKDQKLWGFLRCSGSLSGWEVRSLSRPSDED